MARLNIPLKQIIKESRIPVSEIAKRGGISQGRIYWLLREDNNQTWFNNLMETIGTIIHIVGEERPDLVENIFTIEREQDD